MVNDIGFVVSEEEDLTAGPGIIRDHSKTFVEPSFIKVRKGAEKASDTDSEGGQECPLC